MNKEASPRVSVSPARVVALEALSAVLRQNRNLDEALARIALEGRDRAFAQLLLTTTLRRLGQIDALLKSCLDRPLPKKAFAIEDILRLGAAQLLFLEAPPHAVVSTAVDLARAVGQGPLANLVNAVLRRMDRTLRPVAAEQHAARLNTPDWLWDSWAAAYGETACRAIASAHLEEPPLDITVKSELESWAGRLEGTILPTGSVRCQASGPVAAMPGYASGAWWVQDMAAALPAKLFGDLHGKRIADLCAAPGGKTAQLCNADAKVIAVDSSARRLSVLAANLERLNFSVETIVADAAEWRPAELLDGVLLDAPCTGTGTIRRHPDIPRRRTAEDVRHMAEIQRGILASAGAMLKPGGTLIYSICSIQPEEGPEQITRFLEANSSLRRVPIQASEVGGLDEIITPEGDLRTLPFHLADKGGMDGFYAARLERI